MHPPRCAIAASCLLALATCLPRCLAEPPPAGDAETVRPASFDASAPQAGQSVQFGRRPARLGDEVEQTLSLDVRLSTSLRRGNQLLESERTNLKNTQRRVLKTLAVDENRTMAVRVRYLEAAKTVSSADSDAAATPVAQPVQGKSYDCRRQPGEDGQLIISDESGQTPSPEELEIVAANLEMVGRENPLAEFLTGRTVRIGETVHLPQHVAEQLFDLGDRFGKVTRFDLTLQKIDNARDRQKAAFRAQVEAASNNSSQMRMQVEGSLIVEPDTCRAVSLALSGPVAMSETRGSYSTVYQLIGTGQLTTSISSTYRDAQP